MINADCQHNVVQIISVQKRRWTPDKTQFKMNMYLKYCPSSTFGFVLNVTLGRVDRGKIGVLPIDLKFTTWTQKMKIKENLFSSAFEMFRNRC